VSSVPIPIVSVRGSHREVGEQIGLATTAAVRRCAAAPFDAELVERYRAVTLEHLPWVIEELDGVAAAAAVEPLAVFAASVEELEPAAAPAGCSDLLVTGGHTVDGHLLVAHNNDLYAEDEEDLVALEWRVDGEPTVFTLGNGPWISVGWNDAGLSVTGNELSPNDERVGIPRLLQVRDVLTRCTMRDAVEAILHPVRASSYNWVLAHPTDGALNVEGSATEAGIDEPGREGFLVHTNHYARTDMQEFEKTEHLENSCRRLERARELARSRPATVESLRGALSDHENAPDSICAHGEGPKAVKTVFWCVADVTEGEITFGRGNPCRSTAQTYRFEQ
jgi:isopenicillin-N N-acyltransferase like protein